MTTRAQKVRLGVFMLLAFLLLFGSVATLAGMKLWNPKDRYWVRFGDSVSGLEVGASVKMTGVRVGQVEKIAIDPKDPSAVVVTLSLTPKTPVKTDTSAVLTAIGITGLQFVELTGGSPDTAQVKPNRPESRIPARESTLQSLTGKASDIAKKMEAVLNNLLPLTRESNRTLVRQVLENTNKLLVTWTDLAGGETPARVQRILATVERSSQRLNKTLSQLSQIAVDNGKRIAETLNAAQQAAQNVNRMSRTLKPQATLEEISKAAKALRNRFADPSLDKAVSSINKASSRMATLTDEVSDVVRRRDRQAAGIMTHLDKAAVDLKRFARAIRERPSLLLRGETVRERRVP